MNEDYKFAGNIVIGALKEMLNDRSLTYVSESSPGYSHLEPLGEKYVVELVSTILPLLVKTRAASIKEAAEKRMMEKLT